MVARVKLFRYTFEPRCLEEDFPLEDGTKRIFLSTVGENEKEVPAELVCFLRYVTESTDAYVKHSGNPKLDKIHERVKTLRQSKKLEERYMQFEEMLKREYREGYEEGLKADETFYKEMLEKYHL